MISADTYLLIALALTGVVFSVVFYLAWKTQGRALHTRTWLCACIAVTVQCCIGMGASWFPTVESYWITFNAVGLSAVILALRGHCQRTGCRFLPANLWPYAVAILAAITWFTIANPHVGLRVALLPLTVSLAMFLSAAMVIRYRRHPQPVDRATAITLTLLGLAQLAAAATGILQGAAGDAGMAVLYRAINLISLPAGLAGVATFTVLLLASDQAEQLRKIAVRDQLTGLLNRRGFGEQAARAYATARRIGHPVSVIMADIDQFKGINDQFGHAAGDEALRHVAEVFCDGRRSEDILARLGGEEFAIVLPGTDIAEAMRIATMLCDMVANTTLTHESRTVEMTASFGVATISDKDSCLTDVIIRADKALYRSKRSGRNRVDLDASQIVLVSDRVKDRGQA